MPHIHAYFLDDPDTRAKLKDRKKAIVQAVADVTGYAAEKIAFIPHPIAQADLDIAENVMPLEFVVDVGKKSVGKAELHAERIRQRLYDSGVITKINFGVWLRVFPETHFCEQGA